MVDQELSLAMALLANSSWCRMVTRRKMSKVMTRKIMVRMMIRKIMGRMMTRFLTFS